MLSKNILFAEKPRWPDAGGRYSILEKGMLCESEERLNPGRRRMSSPDESVRGRQRFFQPQQCVEGFFKPIMRANHFDGRAYISELPVISIV